ncbi:MAG: hypothetical protein J2P24_00250 [Streptosporangiales bacterium]|nr:hypothetical protein [Streptosporangiales bacterium]
MIEQTRRAGDIQGMALDAMDEWIAAQRRGDSPWRIQHLENRYRRYERSACRHLDGLYRMFGCDRGQPQWWVVRHLDVPPWEQDVSGPHTLDEAQHLSVGDIDLHPTMFPASRMWPRETAS